jgi:ParB family chromosome partitioning protein
VNRTLSILKLSAPVLDLVGQNPEAFPMSCLSELVLLEAVAGTKTALAFAEKIGQGEMGRKEIIEARTRIETPKSRKRKEISRQYKIHVSDGTQIGALKEWDSGRVSLDVVVSSATDRVALVNELKKRFSIGDA